MHMESSNVKTLEMFPRNFGYNAGEAELPMEHGAFDIADSPFRPRPPSGHTQTSTSTCSSSLRLIAAPDA